MTYRSAIGNTVSCDASSPSLNFEMQRNAKTFSTGKLKNTGATSHLQPKLLLSKFEIT